MVLPLAAGHEALFGLALSVLAQDVHYRRRERMSTGGSAAFLLGIRADLMLPVAGVLVLAFMLLPARESQTAMS